MSFNIFKIIKNEKVTFQVIVKYMTNLIQDSRVEKLSPI